MEHSPDPPLISRAIERNWVDPIFAFRAASGREGRVLLDSGGKATPHARWTVLAVDPVETIETRVGDGLLDARSARDPFASIEALRARWVGPEPRGGEEGPSIPAGVPSGVFTGGVIALLGYDAGRALERLPATALDDPHLPDLWAAAFDGALVFDRATKRVWATSWGIGGEGEVDELEAILERARKISLRGGDAPGDLARGRGGRAGCAGTLVGSGGEPRSESLRRAGASRNAGHAIAPEDGRERFLEGVTRIREEIAKGEIYQANLTRRVVRPIAPSRVEAVYEALRAFSPTPFGAFVDAGAFQLLSVSPERFLRLEGRALETRPIKGTRPRGVDAGEDARLRAELLGSAKEAAELLMIVDLERNDLGRVSRTGSVSVDPSVFTWASLHASLRRAIIWASLVPSSLSSPPKVLPIPVSR